MSRVILANEPPLLRGMLRRVISRAPGLQVVGEATDPAELSSLIDHTQPQWVIVSLWPPGRVPSVVRALLTEQSRICVLGVGTDGAEARLICRRSGEETLTEVSLENLIEVLRSRR